MNKIYRVEEASESSKRGYDCVIFAPNIEKRTRKAIKCLEIGNECQVISCDYYSYNLDKISEDMLNSEYSLPDNTLHIFGDEEGVYAKLHSYITNELKNSKVALDITGFSIPGIYRIMQELRRSKSAQVIDVYYTEPHHYSFEGINKGYHKNKEYKERDCKVVRGYLNTGKKIDEKLIIQLGFDGELAYTVYTKISEDSSDENMLYVVNGLPAFTSKLKDVSLANNSQIVENIPMENIKMASANNPFMNYNALIDVLEECDEDDLLTICSIGSKPMALGACLFSLDYKKRVKVIYPFYEREAKDLDSDELPGKVWRYAVDGDLG